MYNNSNNSNTSNNSNNSNISNNSNKARSNSRQWTAGFPFAAAAAGFPHGDIEYVSRRCCLGLVFAISELVQLVTVKR